MKQLLYLVLIFSLFSCKENIIDANDNSDIKNDVLVFKSEIKVENFSGLKEQKTHYPTDLFNTKLVGLGIKDSSAKNPYNKYWIDFYAYCYSSAISFYIDTKKNKIYAIDYPFEDIPIKNEKILFQFDIKEIINNNEDYQIHLEKVEQFELEDDVKIEYIETIFDFKKLDKVYQLKIKNKPSTLYSYIERYQHFVSKKKEHNFTHEGCGDFDG